MILDNFLYCIADAILQTLASLLAEEIGLATGVKEELKALKNRLSAIKAVLLDAEEQQTKNHQLNDWIQKLKDAFTDADDILDEFEIQHTRQQLVNHRFTKKVREFLPSLHALKFSFSMGHKLKEFNERLNKIAVDRNNFHLTERLEHRHVVHREREMTHSYMSDIDVIGRNDDKENIIQKLMYSSDHREYVSAISIVGIGGLGKSTLAKLVYNDEKVSEHFYLKMWVCVSMDFNLEILMRKIFTSATYRSCGELSIDQLQSKLRRTLSGRKFLLILDDVWNVNDSAKWIELRRLLMDGARRGSKIIVTTRSNSVASIMGDTYIHNLGALSRNDCFSLFVKWAFPEGEERKHPNLLKIGEKIVNKCKGVPLAARTLGSVLFNKTNERDWLQVKESELWNLKDQKQDDILPALRLSYDQLPSYLKQCFAYCSILPRGQYFCKDNLIHLWMAQNLIRSTDQNQELEDVGDQYFNDLCSRSFFQEVENGPFYVLFKMHDLVHDLALYVAQTECVTMKVHRENISRTVRHISLLGCDYLPGYEVPRNLLELEKLRTIFFPRNGIRTSTDCFVDECISNFLLLRVLDLADSHFEVLPSSIRDLKHLRFLDLSSNHRIKKLPKSICKLLLLQTLRFSDCKQLEELPKYIGNLINLRHLYITTQQACFREKGIGCLTSLQSLWITDCVNLVTLPEEIGNLTALRTLAINRCRKLTSLPSCMTNLTKLQNLLINGCEELNLSEFITGTQDLRIQTMVIEELPKLVALPQWLFGSCRSIHHFRIACCPNLEKLPDLPRKSASLQKLEILECPKLQGLPKGFHQLNALKVLRIVKCDKLIRRCQPGTGEDWKMIAHIPEVHLNKTKITYAHF